MSGPSAPERKGPLTENAPEIDLVLDERFAPDRLLDREIELLGSVLPELVGELLQMFDKES